MPDTRYYIVRHDTIWLIKFEDEEYGPTRRRTRRCGWQAMPLRSLSGTARASRFIW